MKPIYIPILKAKAGEFGAVSVLDETLLSKIIPMFEIPPIGIKILKDKTKRKKTFEEHF